MTTRSVVFNLAVCAATVCVSHAQQSMLDMPGMKMSPQQSAPKQPIQPVPTPGDLKSMGKDAGNARAKAAAASEQQSIQQQGHETQNKPGAASDAVSITVPFQEVQEPEAEGFHTGSDLPAPELLRDVVSQQAMTLESFLNMADKSNPTLAEAQRDVERSKQQARQAGLPPDPTVGYSGDHIRGGSYHGGEEGAFFSQEFVLGRKLALRRDIYRAEGRSNELAVEVQRARVHDDVARAFFDALAAQESAVVHDRLLKVALDAETDSHELERIGEADASDVLDAEIAAEQAKVDFESAQRMFLSSFAELAAVSGQRDLAPHPLTGALAEPPQIDAESLVASDTQQSPAVRQAQTNVAIAEARLKDAKRERLPNLNVKAGEWYSGETLGATNNKAGWESFAEAGVQLPLWNRNHGNIEAARVEVERAQEDVTRTELGIRNTAESYAQQYLMARSTAERYRTEMLPRARRAYQLEVTKYQEMGQAYPHVLAAQHLLFMLQLAYIHALNQEWRSAIALQNYTLTNGLDEPTSVGAEDTTMNLPTANGY